MSGWLFPEEMSRDELIALVGCQAGQITAMAGQIVDLVEANEVLAGKLARVEYLLSRNSKNSSSPPSKDDDPGKAPPLASKRRGGGPRRSRGKQPGVNLGWTEGPVECTDRFPQGRCGCGDDLADAADLGVVDRYQQHEIPLVGVRVTQYDQHSVRCGCGRVHTAARPAGSRSGIVGYGPNLQAFVVYLMVVHFIPAYRAVALTGVVDRGGGLGGVRAQHADPRGGAAGGDRQADFAP
jgi:hypothetical protein